MKICNFFSSFMNEKWTMMIMWGDNVVAILTPFTVFGNLQFIKDLKDFFATIFIWFIILGEIYHIILQRYS